MHTAAVEGYLEVVKVIVETRRDEIKWTLRNKASIKSVCIGALSGLTFSLADCRP